METTLVENRIRALMLATLLVLLVMVGRLWQLQLTQWVSYAEKAAGNRTQIVWEPAPRGIILDRNGQVLAKNRSLWDLEVVRAEYPTGDGAAAEQVVRLLARILDVPAPQVREGIGKALKRQALESVPLENLGEDVPLKVVVQVEARQLELPGIRVTTQARRFYPQGKLAAHVLGYVRPINEQQYQELNTATYPDAQANLIPPWPIQDQIYDLHSLVGQAGVEKLLESTADRERLVPVLQGQRGYRVYEVRAQGAPTWLISERAPTPGATVVLTLDARLQQVAEEALDAALKGRGKAGAAVLVDVHTGEVLVLASRPTMDPNGWVKGFDPQQWQKLQNDPGAPLLDHATAGCYAPGSVFKLVSASAALSATDLSVNDHFECGGVIHEGRDHTPFRCWKPPPGHGSVGFYQGMAQSCDIYFYNLVLSKGLGSDELADYSGRFGLGTLTGLGLVGERPGFVPTRRWQQDVQQVPWTTGNTLHYVIGQGALTVTPLQMALVTAAVANGGRLLVPRLVSKIVWPNWLGYGTQKLTETYGRQVDVRPEVLEQVRQGMRLAVTEGTAKALQGLGVSVAGKTGSAQHRLDRPTHAWFVCYAPADNPRYAACVLVEEGGEGGQTAAPIARRILAAAFGVPDSGGRAAGESD